MNGERLLRLAARIMPPARRDWVGAMAGDWDHVPQASRKAYALGCLKVALFERIVSMTATPPFRIVPGLFGAALLAVLCLANALRYIAPAPVVGGFLLLAALLWLAMLLAVLARSSRLVGQVAVVGAALYGAVGVLSVAGAPAFATNAALLRALALEGLLLFAVAFAVSRVRYFWAGHGKGDAAAPPP